MALLENLSARTFELTTGRLLQPGEQANGDPGASREASAIAKGVLAVIDPDAEIPPSPPHSELVFVENDGTWTVGDVIKRNDANDGWDVAQITGGGGGDGDVEDATTSVKGIVRLSSTPATPSAPIALGVNDARLDGIEGASDRLDVVEADVTDLDSRLQDVESSGSVRIGDETKNATAANLNGNHAFMRRVTFNTPGSIADMGAWLDGLGPNTGLQRFRWVVYAGPATAPGALVGRSELVTVTSGDAAARKVFPGVIPIPSAGDYLIGLWIEVGGSSTNQVARWFEDTGTFGDLIYNTGSVGVGTANAGPTDPFGSIAGLAASLVSLDGLFTPAVGIQGVTAYNEGVQVGVDEGITGIDVRGDNVDATVTSGVMRIVVATPEIPDVSGSGVTKAMLANFPIPAGAVVESTPAPGGLVTVSAVGDQSIASAVVQDTVDGTTWRTRGSGGSAATYMTAQAITTRLTQARIVNGGTAQGVFEAGMATA